MTNLKVQANDGAEYIVAAPIIVVGEEQEVPPPTEPPGEVVTDAIQFPYTDWGFDALSQRFWIDMNVNPWAGGTFTSETGRVVSHWRPVSHVMAPMDGRAFFAKHMRAIEYWNVGNVEAARAELLVPCMEITNVVDGSEKAPFYMTRDPANVNPTATGDLHVQSVQDFDNQYKRNPVYLVCSHKLDKHPASQKEMWKFDLKCQIPYDN